MHLLSVDQQSSCRCVVSWYQGTVYHKVCVFIDVYIVYVSFFFWGGGGVIFAFIQGGNEREQLFVYFGLIII